MTAGRQSCFSASTPSLLRRFRPLLFFHQYFLPDVASTVARVFACPTRLSYLRFFTSSFSKTFFVPDSDVATTVSYNVEDPVASFLRPHRSLSLAQLAQKLPDEVLEKMKDGLKGHLERFPSRYRLFQGTNGLFHVCCVESDNSKQGRVERKCLVSKKSEKTQTVATPDIVRGRFVTLESFMRCSLTEARAEVTCTLPTGGGGGEKMADGREAITVDAIERFIFEYLLSVKDVELWLLTEECAIDNLSPPPPPLSSALGEAGFGSIRRAAGNLQEKKEVLQAFRWGRLADKKKITEFLSIMRAEALRCASSADFKNGKKTDFSMFFTTTGGLNNSTTSSTIIKNTLFVRWADFKVAPGVEQTTVTALLRALGCVEEYDVYRLCRVLSTREFMKLSEVQKAVGEWLTQPLAAVLAVGKEESQMACCEDGLFVGRSLLEFEHDPGDLTRVVGVRFWLDEERHLPREYHQMTLEELRRGLTEMEATPRRDLSKLPNHKRVRVIDRKRTLQRCIALHELGVTPMSHPDVLAYYVFDLLPLDGQLILTGHVPQLLPENIRLTTDARSRTWMKSYPHLFRLVENPPELLVQRVDAPTSLNTGEGYKEERTHGKHDVVSTSQPNDDYELQLLNNPEEQVRLMVSIVAARIEVCGSRKLLPSHIPKFLSSKQRRAIMPRGSGGILAFLKRHPDIFILKYGLHPTEPVLTLAPKYHPNFAIPDADVQQKTIGAGMVINMGLPKL